MQGYFLDLADELSEAAGQQGSFLRLSMQAEESDFVRMNQNKVRQAGSVVHSKLGISLVREGREAKANITLSGDLKCDRARCLAHIRSLTADLADLPVDPYLLLPESVRSSSEYASDGLADPHDAVDSLMRLAKGQDLVGMYTAGKLVDAYWDSRGQANYKESYSFQIDWSLYREKDKAIKENYSGFNWSEEALEGTMATAIRRKELLDRPAKTVDRGAYRVFLSPSAVGSVLETLCADGWSAVANRTGQSSLAKLYHGSRAFSPALGLFENLKQGSAPAFNNEGFIRPERLDLIEGGAAGKMLVSPRSAREYDLECNGADADESPTSLEMQAGALEEAEVLRALDTGIYVGNLWYLNYTNRNLCRLTGMTRFGTFWVENGVIRAPLNVMRFDDSAFDFFGDRLLALTKERRMLFDESTYTERSRNSMLVPGVLIDDFKLTL